MKNIFGVNEALSLVNEINFFQDLNCQVELVNLIDDRGSYNQIVSHILLIVSPAVSIVSARMLAGSVSR